MTLRGVGTLDRAAGANFKALCSRLLCFHLRHFAEILFLMIAGALPLR
jgi:hypothetical protein